MSYYAQLHGHDAMKGGKHGGLNFRVSAALLLALVLAITPAQAATPQELAKLDLESYRGKVVYLDFWASWCQPCAQSFPFLDDLFRQHQSRGLVVVGVNVDTERALADRFLARHPVSFPLVFDPQGELAEQWQLETMPMAFLIGKDGTVRLRHPGFRSSDRKKLEELVHQLLAEESP